MRTITLFTVCLLALRAEAEPVRIAWSHTPEVLKDKCVLVQLTTGTKIEGRWISVTADTFTMQVEKSSARNVIGKGTQTLPRSSIAAMRTRNRRVRGRVIGVVGGFYSVAAIASAATRSPDGLQGGWGLAALGGGIAGYFAGRASDRATQEVILLP